MEGSDEEINHVAELVRTFLFICWNRSHPTKSKIQKGVSGARSDNTKSLKGSILDWITPRGEPLIPPLARNVKISGVPARPQAVSQARPGRNRPSQAEPTLQPETAFGLASGFVRPRPGRQAAAFT